MKLFEDTKVPILAKALDAYSLRHKVISSNIANIGTLGYRSKKVQFEEQLAGAMNRQHMMQETTDASHIVQAPNGFDEAIPRVIDANADGDVNVDPTASGVNDVDIDNEMTELAKNQIEFKFAAKLLSDSFQALEKSIRGTT